MLATADAGTAHFVTTSSSATDSFASGSAALPPPIATKHSVSFELHNVEDQKKLSERMRVRAIAILLPFTSTVFFKFSRRPPPLYCQLFYFSFLSKILEEFLQTETSYLADLNSLKKLYTDPLMREPDILPREEFNVIFSVRFAESHSSLRCPNVDFALFLSPEHWTHYRASSKTLFRFESLY